MHRKGTLLVLRYGPAGCLPHVDREGSAAQAPAHLVVSVHHLEASAGLLLLHVAQRTLQAEDHIVRLLDHLRTDTVAKTRRDIEKFIPMGRWVCLHAEQYCSTNIRFRLGQLSCRVEWSSGTSPWTGSRGAGRSGSVSPRTPAPATCRGVSCVPLRSPGCRRGCRSGQRRAGPLCKVPAVGASLCSWGRKKNGTRVRLMVI